MFVSKSMAATIPLYFKGKREGIFKSFATKDRSPVCLWDETLSGYSENC